MFSPIKTEYVLRQAFKDLQLGYRSPDSYQFLLDFLLFDNQISRYEHRQLCRQLHDFMFGG